MIKEVIKEAEVIKEVIKEGMVVREVIREVSVEVIKYVDR